MDYIYLNNIKSKLLESLKPDRFHHSLGVADTAACLAMKYDCNIDDAYLAGLLHDYSKKDSDTIYISFCEDHDINISEAEELNPGLLHAKISAYLAHTEFNVSNADILSSITFHTTGRPNMTLLDKIIYIADYIEPNRYKQKNLDIIRKEAFINLDSCLLMILSDTVDYLKTNNKVIDKTTEETYWFYKRNILDGN